MKEPDSVRMMEEYTELFKRFYKMFRSFNYQYIKHSFVFS